MRWWLVLGLLGCTGTDDKDCGGGACESVPAGDSGDSPGPDHTGETGETGHTGESGGDSVAHSDSEPPWDPNAPLELCINEFMPSNGASTSDQYGNTPDWIELHNPYEEAISLSGWTMTDDRDDTTKTELSGDLTLEPGDFLVLWADGDSSLGAQHLDFKLSEDGGVLGLFAPDGRGSLISYGTVSTDMAAARVPDCCSGSSDCWNFQYAGTPGSTNDPIDPEEEEIVPTGATWAYWDQAAVPEGDWTALGFDDSGWATGAAPLGYGDSHIVTTVGYGGVDTAKNSAAYFRLTFTATDVTRYTELTGKVMRDDGAIVYLNGTEVVRTNMPDGAVEYSTLASTSTTDETGYSAFDVDTSLLLEGVNVFAVEIHQASADSSDLGFDLGLEGEYTPTQ